MKPAVSLRLALGLLLLALVPVAISAASEPAPVPYKRTAHFSKRYDPSIKPDHVASPLRFARLDYPKQWRKWGQPAYAKVEFLIEATGVPYEVQCVEATDRAFAKAAEKCIEQWFFVPALKDQQGVCSKSELRLDFVIPTEGAEKAHPPQASGETAPAAAKP